MLTTNYKTAKIQQGLSPFKRDLVPKQQFRSPQK